MLHSHAYSAGADAPAVVAKETPVTQQLRAMQDEIGHLFSTIEELQIRLQAVTCLQPETAEKPIEAGRSGSPLTCSLADFGDRIKRARGQLQYMLRSLEI